MNVYRSTLIIFVFHLGCAGSSVQRHANENRASELAVDQVYHLPQRYGHTVGVQLWGYPGPSKSSSRDFTACPSLPLKPELRARAQAVGVGFSGFHKEVIHTIKLLQEHIDCLEGWINSAQNPDQLTAPPPIPKQFRVITYKASEEPSPDEKLRLSSLLSSAHAMPSDQPPTTGLRVSINQSTKKPMVTYRFRWSVESVTQLAYLELSVQALSTYASLMTNRSRDSLIETPLTQIGYQTFSFALTIPAPVNGLVSFVDQWTQIMVNTQKPWVKRSDLEDSQHKTNQRYTQLTAHSQDLMELISRIHLNYGVGTFKDWHAIIEEPQYQGWRETVTQYFALHALEIEIDDGNPPNEIKHALLKEAVERKLKGDRFHHQNVSRKTIKVSTQVLVQDQLMQRLRVIIGIPNQLGQVLNTSVKNQVKHCTRRVINRAESAEFGLGTYAFEIVFHPLEMDDVFQQLREHFANPCPAALLPEAEGTQEEPPTLLKEIVYGISERPSSNGTSLPVGIGALSGSLWWSELMHDRPPIQLLTVGPLSSHDFGDHVRSLNNFFGDKDFGKDNYAITSFNRSTPPEGVTVFNQTLVHIRRNLTPRQRMLIDAACHYLSEKVSDVSLCRRTRTPSSPIADFILLEFNGVSLPKALVQKWSLALRKDQQTRDKKSLLDALRWTAIEHENRMNHSGSLLTWHEDVLWQPNTDWKMKHLGTDLIPDLNDHGALNDVLNQFEKDTQLFLEAK